MKKKINNDLAQILKEVIGQELSVYNHIILDSFYHLSDKYFLELTVIYDNHSTHILQERKEVNGHLIQITYYSKNSILKNLNLEDGYLFTCFPQSNIIKDHNRFLVNMKSSLVFFVEKQKTIIHKNEIDKLRWITSNYVDTIKYQDSHYLRCKIYEGLINLYNYVSTNDYIKESSVPMLLSRPGQHPFLHKIVNNNLSSSDFEKLIIQQLNLFGGFLKTIDSNTTFYSNEIVIVFKYENLDLDSFIENIFFKFFAITKNINHNVKSFYWEKNTEGLFSLYLNSDKHIIEKEILPELMLKLNSNVYIKQITDISTIYDFFQEYYYLPLNQISEYILDLKSDECIQWSTNLAISYCIELYLSCFIKLYFSKKDFLEFNNHLSSKWQLFLLSDEELKSNEYYTTSGIYQKFEKLYLINEDTLIDNFAQKIDDWMTRDSFSEEIEILRKNMDKAIERPENESISNSILGNFSNNHKYAFLEGFLFKFFGLMGLDTESKVYITYIINRLSNES